jgi:hypothetical protein
VSTNCLPGSKTLAINGVFADKFDEINAGAMFIVWRRRNALIPTLVAWQDVIQIKLLLSLEIRGRVIEPYNAIILVFHAVQIASALPPYCNGKPSPRYVCITPGEISLISFCVNGNTAVSKRGLGLSGSRTQLD